LAASLAADYARHTEAFGVAAVYKNSIYIIIIIFIIIMPCINNANVEKMSITPFKLFLSKQKEKYKSLYKK